MVFPDSLEDLGYRFNQEGELRSIDTDDPYNFQVYEDHSANQSRYETLGDVITEYVYKLLENRCKLVKMPVPTDTTQKSLGNIETDLEKRVENRSKGLREKSKLFDRVNLENTAENGMESETIDEIKSSSEQSHDNVLYAEKMTVKRRELVKSNSDDQLKSLTGCELETEKIVENQLESIEMIVHEVGLENVSKNKLELDTNSAKQLESESNAATESAENLLKRVKNFKPETIAVKRFESERVAVKQLESENLKNNENNLKFNESEDHLESNSYQSHFKSQKLAENHELQKIPLDKASESVMECTFESEKNNSKICTEGKRTESNIDIPINANKNVKTETNSEIPTSTNEGEELEGSVKHESVADESKCKSLAKNKFRKNFLEILQEKCKVKKIDKSKSKTNKNTFRTKNKTNNYNKSDKNKIGQNQNSAESSKGFIFVSTDFYTNSEKLLILIHGSGVVRAGQWARRLIINDSLKSGTQIPFIELATERGYSVLVMNTNQNDVTSSDGFRTRPIIGSETPIKHGQYVWRNYIRMSKAKNIAIVAHSFGGVVATNLFEEFTKEFEDRVFALAFTDSVHYGVRKIDQLSKFAKNWVTSSLPLDTPIQIRNDVPCVSAGVEQHEMTSYSSIHSIFRFFDEKFQQVYLRKEN